ncbi:MAG: hypothetical protein NTX54_05415 [Chloroflexi bacterium]|nr:hypothetical protein [Chloroflexota bacterium]
MTTECDVPAPDIEVLMNEAFSLIRGRRFGEARDVVGRIEEMDGADPFGAHARIHLHIDEGSFEEGVERGIAYLTANDPFDGLNIHNTMHLASLLMELGRADASIAWQERVMVPSAPRQPMSYPGAVNLLWQTEVFGYGRSSGRTLPWRTLAPTIPIDQSLLTDMSEMIVRIMALVALAEEAGVDAWLAALADADASAQGLPSGEHVHAVRSVSAGLGAWWRGDARVAARHLGEAVPVLSRLTEYPGQFGVIEDTLIEAEWHSGTRVHSERMLRDRVRSSALPRPRDQFWLGRILASTGRPTEGSDLLASARLRWVGADDHSPELRLLERLTAPG